MTKQNRSAQPRKPRLSSIIAVLLSGGLGLSAHAQDLSIQSNQVVVTQSSGGFTATPSVSGNNGQVGDVGGVPNVAGLNVPIFSFVLEGASSVASGAYNFTPGVIIQDGASQRRLEIQLPTLTLNFSGGTMSGTVAAGNSTVLGRSANGSVTLAGTVNDNGSAGIANNKVFFNASSTLTRIQANGGVLGDILNTINAGGAYSYVVVLKQTSGATLRMGTQSGGVLTQFPKLGISGCDAGFSPAGGSNTAASAVFQLNTNQLAASFTGGYALQGRFAISGAQTGTLLPDIGISCTPTPASGGGGGTTTTTTPTTTEVNNAINLVNTTTPPTDSTLTTLTTASSTTTNYVTSVSTTLSSGSGTSGDAVIATNTLNSLLSTTTTVLSSTSGTTSVAKTEETLVSTTQALSSLGQILSSLATSSSGTSPTTTVSTSQLTALSNTASNAFSTAQVVTGKTTSSTTKSSTTTATSNIATQLVNLGAGISSTQLSTLKAISTTVVPPTGASTNKIVSSSVTLTPTNPSALATSSIGSTLGTTVSPGSGVTVDTTVVNSVHNLVSSSVNPDTTVIGGQTVTATINGGFSSIGTTMSISTSDAIRGTGSVVGILREVSATWNPGNLVDTGEYEASSGTDYLSAEEPGGATIRVLKISILPSSISNGASALADGTVLSVNDGVGSTIAPASRDPIGLSAGLLNNAVLMSYTANGGVFLQATSTGDSPLKNGATFSATFGYQTIPNAAEKIGAATFTAPTGFVTDPTFQFTVHYADGTSQLLSPFPRDPNFFPSLEDYGYTVVTNRNTGIITLTGVGSLRPDFNVSLLSPDDVTFRNANQDSYGIAYRYLGDINGDGKPDYAVLSNLGKQVFYGL